MLRDKHQVTTHSNYMHPFIVKCPWVKHTMALPEGGSLFMPLYISIARMLLQLRVTSQQFWCLEKMKGLGMLFIDWAIYHKMNGNIYWRRYLSIWMGVAYDSLVTHLSFKFLSCLSPTTYFYDWCLENMLCILSSTRMSSCLNELLGPDPASIDSHGAEPDLSSFNWFSILCYVLLILSFIQFEGSLLLTYLPSGGYCRSYSVI